MSNDVIYINLQESETCLEKIYLESQIYIKEFWFDINKISIVVNCTIPADVSYTVRPIPYVTAENFIRCLSQASYLLAELAIKNNLLSLEIDADEFIMAAVQYELYYRNLSMTFHKRVNRDEEFKLKLTLPNIREIKRLDQDFILFTFKNEKTVISGEMSFIYVRIIKV